MTALDWDRQTQGLVAMILAGLARDAGGSLVLTEAQLGEEGEQVFIDINEVAGTVTITVIPPFVKVGYEPDKPHLTLSPPKKGTKFTGSNEWTLRFKEE